jgi:predicted Rossmann-fold nucleotide-binding protein
MSENKNKYICYNGPLENNGRHGHTKMKLGVSGAAETGKCGLDALDKAKELGREIIRQGGIIVTGATTGFPLWSAMGAKEVGGISLGLSPAANAHDHIATGLYGYDYLYRFRFSWKRFIIYQKLRCPFCRLWPYRYNP